MATSNNEEIFLADSQGWKEEAQAVIKDVKEQVKDINISDKLQVITTDFLLFFYVLIKRNFEITE